MRPHLHSPPSSQANESQQLLGQKARKHHCTKFRLSEARLCDSRAGQERTVQVPSRRQSLHLHVSEQLGPQVSVWVPITQPGEVLRTSPGCSVQGLLMPLVSVTPLMPTQMSQASSKTTLQPSKMSCFCNAPVNVIAPPS